LKPLAFPPERGPLAVQRRERLLETMLSSIADLAYATDRAGRLVYANKPALELWGLGCLEDALGRTVHELGYPQHLADHVDAQIRRVFASGEPLRDETAFTRLPGDDRYYEYIFAPALAPDGSVEFMVGCSRDITARRRSEQALKESIAEFRTLASAMPQIVWAADAGGECVYLNQQWMDHTGRSLADSLGSGWLEQLHPADRQAVVDTWQEAMHTGRGFSIEVRLVGRDGSFRWWLLRTVPVEEEAGRVIKWIGTCTDVDDLKTAEFQVLNANRELQRQRSELRTLFDLVPAMVWFKDVDGRVLQLNTRAAAVTGLSVEQAVGRTIAELFPDKAVAYAEDDQDIIRTNQPSLGKIEKLVDADGGESWFQSDKVPFRDEDGKVRGIMVMKHDITERKRVQDALHELNASLDSRVRERTAELALAREEAERANNAKSTFLATMSHEIRTPMAGLLGLLELLELTPLDAEQRSTLSVARESGRALKRIIDGILDFARIEAQSLELDVAPGSLAGVVEGSCRLHAPTAAGKSVVLQTTLDPRIAACHLFDGLRVGQIVGNLLGNAIKFTEQGRISVEAELAGRDGDMEHVRIRVRDTGIGIPQDKLARLFRPYGQADARTSTTYGGTGLGLFIARRLAELMGGTLTLESEPGVGTVVTLALALPVSRDGASPESFIDTSRDRLNLLLADRPAAQSVEQAEQSGTLLLVVDDHPINRLLLLRQAATLGYAAEAAVDGVQAYRAWQSGRFAAILTDCNMPRMNGFELAQMIREREAVAGGHTPIIGCTANAMAAAADECIRAGMDDYVAKPVALEELCARLDRWLPLHGGPREVREPPAPAPRRGIGTGEGLVDLALVNTIASGHARARERVISDFQQSNAADAAQMRGDVARGDLRQVTQSAHRLRGACAMMGATRLADACGRVQEAAASGRHGAVDKAMEGVEVELLRLNRYLASLL
jgi:PAS domain S-box-containing protein